MSDYSTLFQNLARAQQSRYGGRHFNVLEEQMNAKISRIFSDYESGAKTSNDVCRALSLFASVSFNNGIAFLSVNDPSAIEYFGLARTISRAGLPHISHLDSPSAPNHMVSLVSKALLGEESNLQGLETPLIGRKERSHLSSPNGEKISDVLFCSASVCTVAAGLELPGGITVAEGLLNEVSSLNRDWGPDEEFLVGMALAILDDDEISINNLLLDRLVFFRSRYRNQGLAPFDGFSFLAVLAAGQKGFALGPDLKKKKFSALYAFPPLCTWDEVSLAI